MSLFQKETTDENSLGIILKKLDEVLLRQNDLERLIITMQDELIEKQKEEKYSKYRNKNGLLGKRLNLGIDE